MKQVLRVVALFLAANIVLPTPATADDEPLKPETEPWRTSREAIPTLVANFANIIGCNVFVRQTNIVSWNSNAPDGSLDDLVVYTADTRCSSGNKNDRSYFALVRRGDYGHYYVDANLSSPAQTRGFPRYITRIYERDGKVYFEAQAEIFACCPSPKVEGQIGLKNNQWVPLESDSTKGLQQ